MDYRIRTRSRKVLKPLEIFDTEPVNRTTGSAMIGDSFQAVIPDTIELDYDQQDELIWSPSCPEERSKRMLEHERDISEPTKKRMKTTRERGWVKEAAVELERRRKVAAAAEKADMEKPPMEKPPANLGKKDALTRDGIIDRQDMDIVPDLQSLKGINHGDYENDSDSNTDGVGGKCFLKMKMGKVGEESAAGSPVLDTCSKVTRILRTNVTRLQLARTRPAYPE